MTNIKTHLHNELSIIVRPYSLSAYLLKQKTGKGPEKTPKALEEDLNPLQVDIELAKTTTDL